MKFTLENHMSLCYNIFTNLRKGSSCEMNHFDIKTQIYFGEKSLDRLLGLPYKKALIISDPGGKRGHCAGGEEG